jgi:hypothetical protein
LWGFDVSEESDIFDHPDLRDTDWSAKLRREVRRSRWRRNRTWISVLVVLVVVSGGVVAYTSLRPNENKQVQGPPPTSENVPTTPTTPTSTVRTSKVNLKQPFVATPAAGWADGVAGLVVPQAAAVNGFTVDKVTKALNLTRDAVSTAELDRRVIQDGNMDVLTALFAPDNRKDIRDQWSNRHVRIKPGYQLLDVSPKMKGELTVSAGEKGEIVVRANYAVAYAFYTDNPDKLVDAMDIVAVGRFDEQYVYRESGRYAKSSWGLWQGSWQSFWFSASCSAFKDGMLAPAYSERRYDISVPIPTSAAFDPSAPMPTTGNCPS